MKSFIIILFASIVINCSAGFFVIEDLFYEFEKAVLDDKLKLFLENLKPVLKTGNESLGIPVLDPFETEYEKINITEDIVSIDSDLWDAKVDGLSEYIINDAKFKLAGLKIMLNLTWPEINVKSSYRLKAEFEYWKDVSVFGKGDVRFKASGFTFAAIAKLGVKSNRVYVKELSTGLSLKAIDFTATGIYNNEVVSETINAVINSSLIYVIENYQWLITNEINVRLMLLINTRLRGLTLQDIINAMG